MKPPIEGMKEIPFGLPEMMPAWLGLVCWAAKMPDIVRDFEKDTGLNIMSLLGRSPIDRMIDAATGYEGVLVTKWCDWVTVNLWGDGTDPETAQAPDEPKEFIDPRQLTLF